MHITFYGVRGSCPSPAPENQRYGGNTACVVLQVPGDAPIILDLGTGLRRFGDTQPLDGTFRGTALVTHIHWDHVQGLPFFPPIHRAGATLDVYGPAQAADPSAGGPPSSLESAFGELIRPPFFPVHYSQLHGAIAFHDVNDDDVAIGNAKVMVRPVPHCGPTVGYRVQWDGVTVAYISDHQAPLGLDTVAESVLELCDGADLLIHDAQYTPEEFARKMDWGHCTVAYSVLVAQRSGAKMLALFHHDPSHGDDCLDGLLAGASAQHSAVIGGPTVISAVEGLTVDL